MLFLKTARSKSPDDLKNGFKRVKSSQTQLDRDLFVWELTRSSTNTSYLQNLNYDMLDTSHLQQITDTSIL